MKAIGNRVILKDAKEEKETESGIILNTESTAKNPFIDSEVLSVGNLVIGVKAGDIVVNHKNAGFQVEDMDGKANLQEGEKLRIVDASELVAIRINEKEG